MERLTDAEIERGLAKLPGWEASGNGIRKTYHFSDFAESMQFVNLVAQFAEAAGHHPDIDIRYDRVVLELTTHSAGGLTAKDLDLAGAIEAATGGRAPS